MSDDVTIPEDPQLTANELALRNTFLDEYMKDFNPFYAAIRCGFPATMAAVHGKILFEDSYVQRKIQELTRTAPANLSDQLARDRELIINTYRNAMANGTKAEATAAASKLALMLGFEKPDGIGDAAAALTEAMAKFAQKAPV